MPRDIPVGNGNVLVAFDRDYLIREFYFPYVGEENHAKREPWRFGVWADGSFSWVPDGWEVSLDYLDDTLVTNAVLVHARLGLRITSNDLVDYQEDIYLRRLLVEDLSGREREVRLFFGQDFHISGNAIGDTAAFRPETRGLLHYKGERHFLVGVRANKKFGIDDFATGNKELGPGAEGTWRDAEDGALSGNPIAQGSVDSVAGIRLRVAPGAPETCFYWICAGRNWEQVASLNASVVRNGPPAILARTLHYWRLWLGKERLNYSLLPAPVARLYRRSLLIARTQIDNRGAIVAANDSDAIRFNRDTYSYVWPRDGALAAHAFALAGYPQIADRFLLFCARVIERGGYFLHKYTPSGVLASSWHPWLKDNRPQLPIQEDETALVLWALRRHFELFKDIELVKSLYRPLIRGAADFMMNYRDLRTRLPLPSYDLWEERQGVLAFTCAAVHGGLSAAASFAEEFGDAELGAEYRRGAAELRAAMDEHLYLPKEKRFARMISFGRDGSREVDSTVDASLYGLFAFGAYDARDERVESTMRQVRERLRCAGSGGGLARYEGDPYYRADGGCPGNPWIITTLWLAQYYCARARTREELDRALPLLDWVRARALPSGCLAEQVDPGTNAPLSVSPLTWSHATFVATVQHYIRALCAIERCGACGQPRYSRSVPHPSPAPAP